METKIDTNSPQAVKRESKKKKRGLWSTIWDSLLEGNQEMAYRERQKRIKQKGLKGDWGKY